MNSPPSQESISQITDQNPGLALQALEKVRQELLAERTPDGHWTGELSTSALSTATAVMAFHQPLLARPDDPAAPTWKELIERGVLWLVEHRNPDGGWGDTVRSNSNISTSTLAGAVLEMGQSYSTCAPRLTPGFLEPTRQYLKKHGGPDAIRARYGKDRTFSVPILMHSALGGVVEWKEVAQLPFELACLPANWYKWAQLPVVSYALPALIAIGLVKHRKQPTWFLPWRWLRNLATKPALKVLKSIQPTTGGFLEAAPLTSFVTMSLVAAGEARHPVVQEALRFLENSVRPDGSWPIDTNLATWTTTLSLQALGEAVPQEQIEPVVEWLLGQQYQEVHPYTNADPGGWAWTDLPGGVPDADDTPSAMLALTQIRPRVSETQSARIETSLNNAARWLLSLQNRDGGWPTFCRGWGKLPFDRSSCDISAHVLRALQIQGLTHQKAIQQGYRFLQRQQREDGAWLPLWFGNQFAPDDENPIYGTSRVLLAYTEDQPAILAGLVPQAEDIRQRGIQFLLDCQNPDGGWGGTKQVSSSVEETSLALTALQENRADAEAIERGLNWLSRAITSDQHQVATPIGFYFAKLWYF
ncbi:MAG: squalene--hopene cyclase, partial [Planctomycetaceae bacterium]|nr:squalene--hopene cyclase [Planctomycetaceae bacterium]